MKARIRTTMKHLFSALFLAASSALAHEEGAPFSGAILDPLVVHHAHIENEQRFNFITSKGVRDRTGQTRNAFAGEFELAYSTPDFRYGFELFVPTLNIPSPTGSGRQSGIGDVEFRPLKLALYNSPAFVVSTATAFVAPTGSKRRGLGEGEWRGAQFLLTDFARGNWYLGTNLALETSLTGPRETAIEYGLGLSYSFIRHTKAGETAATRPRQRWVISPSIESVGERSLRGAAAGENALSLIPGIMFWHVRSGWQIRIGVEKPVSGPRAADAALLVQVGNHLAWGRVFNREK